MTVAATPAEASAKARAWAAPVPAVGVVCVREGADGPEVLLIRRGQPPLAGAWSLPGGRIEPGERSADAALRELAEETGVRAELAGLVDVVDGLFAHEAGGPGRHYVLIDYAARWLSGEPRAGDDAAEAAFVRMADLAAHDLWSETARVIRLGAALARRGATSPAQGRSGCR